MERQIERATIAALLREMADAIERGEVDPQRLNVAEDKRGLTISVTFNNFSKGGPVPLFLKGEF